jgi:hypothetical protein
MADFSSSNSLFQGVVQGCLIGQQDRVDQINERIKDRQYPDTPLRPNYDPRPVSTKYSHFPIINRRINIYEPFQNYSLGISSFSPYAKYGTTLPNVDIEMNLRNQFVSLQHGADQGVYVPSSKSDLFQIPTYSSSIIGEQPFPTLSSIPQYSNNRVIDPSIGKNELFNHTRTQLRNSI